ncbi:hypothetical protein F7725_024715 [Dissostichus mawsoni]|uniref:Uncharacterized protein n=1 Tax=Dissostichus mawsoni TaxID=36200 RepID=A0A7J5X9C9_DISMA|nr:hypothetical protein F7725_024715 [Dissostichus mawsoni]
MAKVQPKMEGSSVCVPSTFVVAMQLTKPICWNPFSLSVRQTSQRSFTFSFTTFRATPISSTLSFTYRST